MDIDLYRLLKFTCTAENFQGPITFEYTAVFGVEIHEPSDMLNYSPLQRTKDGSSKGLKGATAEHRDRATVFSIHPQVARRLLFRACIESIFGQKEFAINRSKVRV